MSFKGRPRRLEVPKGPETHAKHKRNGLVESLWRLACPERLSRVGASSETDDESLKSSVLAQSKARLAHPAEKKSCGQDSNDLLNVMLFSSSFLTCYVDVSAPTCHAPWLTSSRFRMAPCIPSESS